MKAREVVKAVRRHYSCEGDDGIGPEWASLAEVELNGPRTARIDLLFVRAWSGRPKGHERHAVEVKVDRRDLRRELETQKWKPWQEVTHRFWVAVPETLEIDVLEIPEMLGVLEVRARGVHRLRNAPKTEARPLPERLMVEFARRASRAEARIRDAANGDTAAQLAAAQRTVDSLNRRLMTAEQRAEREHQRARHVLDLFANVAGDVRCRCGTPMKLRRQPFGRSFDLKWEHDGEPGSDWFDETRPCRWPSLNLEELAARNGMVLDEA